MDKDKSMRFKSTTMPNLGSPRHRKQPIVDTMPRRGPARKKAITWRATAAAMLPLGKYRKYTKAQSQEHLNGRPAASTVDVSLIQVRQTVDR